MVVVCEEMQKFRKMLDEKGIEWNDCSTDYESFNICRTHFSYEGDFYSVINGFGTYGGYFSLKEENQGLLEVMVNSDEPIGYLTADEVFDIVMNGGEKEDDDY